MGSHCLGERIVSSDERHSYCLLDGLTQAHTFPKLVRKYVCALLNSKGGKLYLGVDHSGRAVGIPMSRKEEDLYRLAIDDELTHFTPPISHGYTVTVIPLAIKTSSRSRPTGLGLILIRVRPGELNEIYEDRLHDVHIMRGRAVHGPLKPMEIRDLVLEKVKREIQCGGLAQVLGETPQAPPAQNLQAIAEEEGT